jgi:hypothetical protein
MSRIFSVRSERFIVAVLGFEKRAQPVGWRPLEVRPLRAGGTMVGSGNRDARRRRGAAQVAVRRIVQGDAAASRMALS